MATLSDSLFAELSPRFFRVLTGAHARIYVDVLDLLEQEASARIDPLERDEAVSIVETFIERRGWTPGDEDDEELSGLSTRDRARHFVERLKVAGWLREEGRSDWRKLLFFDENAAIVLATLRGIAAQQSGLVQFSDKLVNVCLTVCGPTFAEDPWAQLQSCRSLVEDGLHELRQMGKTIEKHTRRQLDAATLRDNLALVFDEFSGKISTACYAELVRARLPSRLAEARQALDRIQNNASLLDRMHMDLLAREQHRGRGKEGDAGWAMARVHNEIDALGTQLARVVPLADEIDHRASEFARKSLARFRYLQEVAGERRETVQTFFETLNSAFAGKTYAQMSPLEESIPRLLVADVRWPSGLECLYTAHLRRDAGEVEPLDEEESSSDDALRQLQQALRDSLTLHRANHFVAGLQDERTASRDIPLPTSDEIEDLIACLLHAESGRAAYRVEYPRAVDHATAPDFDPRSGLLLESFTIVKK